MNTQTKNFVKMIEARLPCYENAKNTAASIVEFAKTFGSELSQEMIQDLNAAAAYVDSNTKNYEIIR